MAVVLSLNTHKPFPVLLPLSSPNYRSGPIRKRNSIYFAPIRIPGHRHPFLNNISNKEDSNPENAQEEVADHEVNDLGVKAALSMLKFYKREISPLLPRSCRYVPTCSEYSMEAYKKYGVVKGTVLTAWRLCRCNPLGGSGFDPPRWFDERSLPEE